MRQMAFRAALGLAAMLVLATPVTAQPRRNYDVRPMNFDLWCQETLALPAERCLKRLPEDVEAFEAHSRQIQAYEIPHLQQKNRQAQIEADILHSDPVDRSPLSVLRAQGNQGTMAPPLPRTVP